MADAKVAIPVSEESSPYPLIARQGAANALVSIGDVVFGGSEFVVIAGPCAVESQEQIEHAARMVQQTGGRVLRGGAFKPRTSPYSFQGLGLEGIEYLRRASLKAEIPFITEVMTVDSVEELEARVDAFQIGTRNMHNFDLLRAIGETRKPVMLKRGFGATLKEWMFAAEYIAKGGNSNIILCERGIRSFAPETRFTLDLAGAVWAKQESCLPVIIDPSHATGLPQLISPLTRAAAAAGLDGVMVEIHDDPSQALSDGDQALTMRQFETLIRELKPVVEAMGRRMENV